MTGPTVSWWRLWQGGWACQSVALASVPGIGVGTRWSLSRGSTKLVCECCSGGWSTRHLPDRSVATMDSRHVRRRLLEEQERLLREIDSLEEDLSEPPAEASEENHHRSHMAEAAAFTLDRQMELTLEENARHAL